MKNNYLLEEAAYLLPGKELHPIKYKVHSYSNKWRDSKTLLDWSLQEWTVRALLAVLTQYLPAVPFASWLTAPIHEK